MTTQGLNRDEKRPEVIAQAILELQQGRSNAHGEVTLAVAPAVSTIVEDLTCTPNTTVVIVPLTANAANLQRTTDMYVVPQNGFFEIFHASSANVDNTYRYSIQG